MWRRNATVLRRRGRRARPGVTLFEFAIAIALGGAIIATALMASRQAQETRRRVRQASEVVLGGLQVTTAVRADLEAAGRGTFSTYNWSGINVQTAGPDSLASDTLLVMWGADRAGRASVHPCRSPDATPGASCVAVVGDWTNRLEVGDVLVIGSPGTGARLVQVTAIRGTYNGKCGADCELETLTCPDPVTGPLTAPVVVGSILHRPDNSTVTSSEPCTATFFADGSWCEEQLQSQVVGNAVAPTCAVTASPAQTYTDVEFEDRTARFGYPGLLTATTRSGANGVPQVVVQKLDFARYWVARTNPEHPSLLKQVALTATGEFAPGLPVAGDVADFRVEVQHAGDSSYGRGTGLTAGALAMSAENPNFRRETVVPVAQAVPAFSFGRSYRTIAAVQVRATLQSRHTEELSPGVVGRKRLTVSALRATNALLDGGVVDLAP